MGSRINSGKPRNSSLTQAIVLFFFPRARERKRKNFFPQPYPFTLAVNISPAVFSFFFYHARSTDFEEKIEDL